MVAVLQLTNQLPELTADSVLLFSDSFFISSSSRSLLSVELVSFLMKIIVCTLTFLGEKHFFLHQARCLNYFELLIFFAGNAQ